MTFTPGTPFSPAAPSLTDRAMRAFPVRHPDARLRIGALLHFAGAAPRRERLRDHVLERLPALPALTHYLGDAGTEWAAASRLEPATHVVDHPLPPGHQNLERAVQRLLRDPLPEGAPHWRLWLLHGHAPGTYAVLYLVHHAVQDGAGMLHTLETLFTPHGVPEEQSSAVFPGLLGAPPPTVRDRVRALATTARPARRTGVWTSARHPLSARRTFRWARVPTRCLRQVAAPVGGSSNDAYLATLAHALQDWAAAYWPPAHGSPGLDLVMPANVRRPGEAGAPGNRTAMVRLTLPGGDAPLADQLVGAVRATAPLKSHRHREALRRTVAGPRLPAWALRGLTRRLAGPSHAVVGVSGLVARHELRWAADPVIAVEPVGCLPEGSPLGVLMLTYGGMSAACFMADRAVPGLSTVHLRWERVYGARPRGPGCRSRPCPAGLRPRAVLAAWPPAAERAVLATCGGGRGSSAAGRPCHLRRRAPCGRVLKRRTGLISAELSRNQARLGAPPSGSWGRLRTPPRSGDAHDTARSARAPAPACPLTAPAIPRTAIRTPPPGPAGPGRSRPRRTGRASGRAWSGPGQRAGASWGRCGRSGTTRGRRPRRRVPGRRSRTRSGAGRRRSP
ncbi:hypothetical protein J7E86_19410 [Streptomyces sp. ISL-11]|nr:hypothetical protein [Streptomyces sp. ISL-11]